VCLAVLATHLHDRLVLGLQMLAELTKRPFFLPLFNSKTALETGRPDVGEGGADPRLFRAFLWTASTKLTKDEVDLAT